MEVFVGTFVHSTDALPMVIHKNTVMGILDSKIEFMENIDELEQLKAEYGFTDSNIHYMTSNQFMIPGLIDTHVHAPQLPNNGLGTHYPLLEWLDNYTYPTESSFSDTLFARDVYNKVVERLLRNGTTTACYYSSLHLEASKILADVVNDKGQRACIGKVNMLRNCPEYYREPNLNASLRDTEEFILYVKAMQTSLVQPVVTPRFAATCPEEQMQSLANLAIKHDCLIQSHLSESQAEVNWMKELFPWSKSYTDIYDSTNLLGEKTIMAHCIYLSDEELYTLRERNVGVAVCPNSNFTLNSGICNVSRLVNAGLKIGLGTDCSGGYSSSILNAIRLSIIASTAVHMQNEHKTQKLSLSEVFKMATYGGAKVLNIEDKTGNFEVEKDFDALLIDVNATNSPIDLFGSEDIEAKIQKFFYTGDDRNIIRVYVAGKRVFEINPTTENNK